MCIKCGPFEEFLEHLRTLLLIISREFQRMKLLAIDPGDDEGTIIENC